jgi:hypothetical protein
MVVAVGLEPLGTVKIAGRVETIVTIVIRGHATLLHSGEHDECLSVADSLRRHGDAELLRCRTGSGDNVG